MIRPAHRRPIARFIRVFNPDGTLKCSYELNDHGRLLHPIRVNVATLPRNGAPPAGHGTMGNTTHQETNPLSQADFMAALEPSIPFLDDPLASPDGFDSAHAFQYLLNMNAAPTQFGDLCLTAIA
jgi:hypothetical protein